ncbi:MAG: O-antigen ligase family protein [Candidatus Omnitrophota bacterium]
MAQAKSKISAYLWTILVVLIALRPFLSEHAYRTFGFWYVQGLIFFSAACIVFSPRPVFPRSELNRPIIIFLGALLLSAIFSVSTLWSFLELFWFIPNILLFYVVRKAGEKERRQLLFTLIAAASLIALYALYQYFVVLKNLAANAAQLGVNEYVRSCLEKKRVFATFISPNIYAGYLLMTLFLALGLLIEMAQEKKIVALILGVCLAVSALALILTKSLAAVIIFLLALALFFFLLIRDYGVLITRKRFMRQVRTVILIAALLFVTISGFYLKPRLKYFLDFQEMQNSLVQRSYYWQASVAAIKDYPLTGTGWRAFGLVYKQYKTAQANISHYSHNFFLQIMAETGPLGLIGFLWFLGVFFRQGLANVKKKAASAAGFGISVGLFCAGCAFLLHNLVDLSFYYSQAAFLWWIVLAFIDGEYEAGAGGLS